MKKILMLFTIILLGLSLVGCGGGGGISGNVTDTVNEYSFDEEETETYLYYTNLMQVKYSTYDKYDFQENWYTTHFKLSISKRDTTFTTTLYSQTYLVTKTGDSKYELTTNGTTTEYTSLQTVFNIINQFS